MSGWVCLCGPLYGFPEGPWTDEAVFLTQFGEENESNGSEYCLLCGMNVQRRIHCLGVKRERHLKDASTSRLVMALLLCIFGQARVSVFAQTEEERISELHRREILGKDDGWMNLDGASYLPGVLLLVGVILLVIFLMRGRPMV